MSALTIRMAGTDITASVDQASVVMQLAGSQDTASCEYDIIDPTNAISVTDEALTTITEVGSATVLFGGFVRSRTVTAMAVGRVIHVMAFDYNQILDRQIVISDKRSAGESDNARLQYLMTTYGSQLSSDYSQITTLNASMPAQKFVAITLRQALERVMGQASVNAAYYVDTTGRLVYYNRTTVTVAPFNVSLTQPPGAGNLAPSDFRVDNDSSNMANAVYVVGATAAGSGWFTDVTSISTYGRRERFVNAPDSDTSVKAAAVGRAMLRDQKNPIPRGVFTTQSPNDGWRIGQTINVTSAAHGFAATAFRVARVTVHYLDPAGDREYTIEIGGPLATISAQLGATFGGGGGFPWHSPGGSGWGGGAIGSGTTGGGVSSSGGCSCNTPYTCSVTTFDDFNRTVVAGAGTASGGSVWGSVTTPGGTDWGVNGSQMFCGLSGGTFRIRTATGPWTTANATTGATRFYFVQPAGVFANYGSFTMFFTGTGGTIGWNFSLNTTTFIINTAGGTTQSYTYPAVWRTFDYSTAQIWFDVKWTINWATGDISARIYLETDGDPGVDQVTMPAAAAIGLTGTIQFNAQVSSSFSTRAEYVDFINIDPVGNCGPPSSGQPYPKTYLRNGDGFTTAFSTLTNYQAGSLLVYVDGLVQTTTTESPTSGHFSLGFAPTPSQKVYASWTVA